MSLRGARQCEAVLALRPYGKSLSTELWILLASSPVTFRLRFRLKLRLGLRLRLRLGLRIAKSGIVPNACSIVTDATDAQHHPRFALWVTTPSQIRVMGNNTIPDSRYG